MMSYEPIRSNGQGWGVVLSYLLAAVTGAVGLGLWLLGRSLILELLQATGISVWAWGAIDKFGFLFLAIAWLVLVLFSQHYFESGFGVGRLWRRFFRVLGAEALTLAIVLGSITILK
jgi:hypothetical protein